MIPHSVGVLNDAVLSCAEAAHQRKVWDDSPFQKGSIKNGSFCCKPRASLEFNSFPAPVQYSKEPFSLLSHPFDRSSLIWFHHATLNLPSSYDSLFLLFSSP